MISIIIIIISILLDGILTNYLPYLVNDLSLFTPLLTLVSIFIICPFFRKSEKTYYILAFIIGIIYDLLYTNLLFFNGVLFLAIANISKYIYKNYEITSLRLIVYTIILITIYESMIGIILFSFQLVPITFYKVIYKIGHSLLLNIIYAELLYLVLNKILKRHKKISIN